MSFHFLVNDRVDKRHGKAVRRVFHYLLTCRAIDRLRTSKLLLSSVGTLARLVGHYQKMTLAYAWCQKRPYRSTSTTHILYRHDAIFLSRCSYNVYNHYQILSTFYRRQALSSITRGLRNLCQMFLHGRYVHLADNWHNSCMSVTGVHVDTRIVPIIFK